jgi:hypothetical protein
MGPRGFVVEEEVVVPDRPRAVFHGAQMEMILEQDGLRRRFREPMAVFHRYYRTAVLLRIAPVLLRHYGLLSVM